MVSVLERWLAAKDEVVRRKFAFMAKIAAVALFVVPFVTLIAIGDSQPQLKALAKTAAPLILTPFWVAGGFIWNFARRIQSKPVTILDLAKIAEPVLFLRSFASDRQMAAHSSSISLSDTNEQSLARLFNMPPRFVAVGRPNEYFPTLGAQRVYISDDEWQDEVSNLIGRSALIFLQSGTSDGLQWEVSEIARQRALPRTVLFLPQDENAAHTHMAFVQGISRILGLRIPDSSIMSSFIAFDESTKPIYTDMYRPFYNIGPMRKRDIAAFSALFRPRKNFNFVHYARMLAQMNPALLYRAELLAILPTETIRIDVLPFRTVDYVVWVVLAIAALSPLFLIVAAFLKFAVGNL